ncbi:hypothetical protein AK812_SmicGene530 [Symbiodinium microadriaticum]|uniref:Uncharacterized protein n=2 Tax=Symbiodinium TaxID=2949 RepID=A0A1Q9F6M7_SYMMI|nr:hypothetical protein AK812_SmicGene530 [Symbiodinium microadriaticum]
MVLALGLERKADSEQIFFVGNSYTFFWNLPQTVQAMARIQNRSMEVQQSTASGASLEQHWKGEKGLQTVQRLRSDSFDCLVLQDHSLASLEAPKEMIEYGRLLAEEAQKRKAKIFVFMTWAREFDPSMQAAVEAQYEALAKVTGAEVIPVGLAWQRARELRGGFPLYASDKSHPTPLGTYLSACVFYGVLTGRSPVGLASRLTTQDLAGEKIYLNIQSEEDARFCQEVAEETILSSRQSFLGRKDVKPTLPLRPPMPVEGEDTETIRAPNLVGLSNPQNVQLTVEITCVDREDQFRRLLAAEDAVHDLAASAGGRMTQSLGAAPEATFNAYLLLVQAFAAQVLPEGAMTRAQAICLALYALQRPLPGQQSLERRGQDLFHDFLHFCVDFFGEDWCEKRLCDLLAIDVNGSAWRRLAADSGCELYMYTPPKGDAAVASNIGRTIQTEAVAQGARELLCAGYDLGDGQIRQTDFRC